MRIEQSNRGAARTTGSPAAGLLWSKLSPPASRAGLLARAGLQALLQAGLQAKLCLLSAPAGFGKTTLLTQVRAAAGAGRVAWVSLDEGDNDPTRFWLYVIEALRTVDPGVGTAELEGLRRTGADLYRAVLPSLVNQLSGVGTPLVLVLDDYHLITNPTCHQTLGFFLDHLPEGVHVALSTRVDPPLPLARMRARGELAEVRAADLQFTDQEASELLNGSMGLRLADQDVARLTQRTEGWAAGLILAGLSLRGRQDAGAFIAAFHGDHAGARAVVEQARELIEQFTDPGMLPVLLEHIQQRLASAPRRRVQAAEPLTERELAVLRLLPTRLSNRQIGRELYVSVNTVRSQVQAVYRKLGARTRAEAVTHARELGLLPGPGLR